MITIKSDEEIKNISFAAKVVAIVHQEIKKILKPGMTGKKLNKLAEKIIKNNNCFPNFKGYYGFPGSICVSVNEQLVHGIPNDKPFKKGDLVSVDVGCKYKGYHADAAFTVIIDDLDSKYNELLKITKESLNRAIKILKPGIKIGDISNIIQKYVESFNYHLPKNYSGHGIGLKLHEDPIIPNFGKPNQGIKLKKGMVICIEPMVQIGTDKTKILNDNWTVVSEDGSYSAHFEHTIEITKDGYKILSKL